VELLRTLAAISDPANEHLFTAEAAPQAFERAKSTSMARMLASAEALHERGELNAEPLPEGVERPAMRQLRVKGD
jgi:hypothetical protein